MLWGPSMAITTLEKRTGAIKDVNDITKETMRQGTKSLLTDGPGVNLVPRIINFIIDTPSVSISFCHIVPPL